MPSLVLFGIPTFVAGDDLRTFTGFALTLRLLQIVVLIPYTVFTVGKYDIHDELLESCGGDSAIRTLIESANAIFITFLCTSYITTIGGLVIEIGIWNTSAKGTPVETEKRKRLHPLCRTKLIPMSVLRITNMVLGVILIKILNHLCWCGGSVTDPLVNCPDLERFITWQAILIGTFFLEFAVVSLTGMYFFWKKTGHVYSPNISQEAKWQCCCRCCCTVTSILTCCLYGGRDGGAGDFADIAILLSDFFDNKGTLDIVASDVTVGLRTLAKVQHQKQSECRLSLRKRVSFVVSMKKSYKGLKLDTAQLLELQATEESNPEVKIRQAVNDSIACVNEGMEQSVVASSVERSRVVAFAHEQDGNVQLVSFADEEMGHVSTVNELEKSMIAQNKNSWADVRQEAVERYADHNHKASSLSSDVLVEDIVAELGNRNKHQETSSVFDDFEAIQIVDDLAEVALRNEDDPLLPEQNNRRKAVVYNLHRNGGFLDYKPSFRNILSRKNDEDRLVIAEGARFIRLSAGIYYFRRYQAQGRACEICCVLGEKGKAGIQKAGSCMNRCRLRANEMVGHDLLPFRIGHGYSVSGILEARFLAVAGLDDYTEIKYIQFGEGVARTPYCISVDHAWQSVVIVIRGTEGFDDVVADLRMVPVSMAECGSRCGFDGQNSFVHSGMLACAEWIYSDLESHGLIDKLLIAPRHTGYTLRLTGHSLGAGVAAILSFMMKSKYPNLRCHCFSPPGCTVSDDMAESCKEYLTSYVLDHDIVPRISTDSLENLRDDMLDMIARLKVTKLEANRANENVDKYALLHRQNSTPPSNFKTQLDEFRERLHEAKIDRYFRSTQLFPPGKIVQLVKTADDEPPVGCCCSPSTATDEDQNTPYAARWAKADDFKEILISPHFLNDHSTVNVMRELERTAAVFGLSAPYTIGEVGPTHFHPRRAFAASLFRRNKDK